MPEPQPQFIGPAGQASLTPPDKRGAGLTDRDQVNVWVQADDRSARFAPDQQPAAGGAELVGEQPAFSETTGAPLIPMSARGLFPRSLTKHLEAAMRVATMPTPPIVGGDFRAATEAGDELGVGIQPVSQEATVSDERESLSPGTQDDLSQGDSVSPHGGEITLQATGAGAQSPKAVAETPAQQAPSLSVGRSAASRKPAVGPFGAGFVALGLSTGRGARGESRLLPGSVLTTTVAAEQQ